METLASQLQETLAIHALTVTPPQPSQQFPWICGNDSHLRHLKMLDTGAYSEVHQVFRPPVFHFHSVIVTDRTCETIHI